MAEPKSPLWEATWSWWSGLANFETRQALPGEMKLGRMEAILGALGSPHLGPRVIHITGTKGKGSTSAMIESVLRAAGWRTALYTSPHLADVTERFQVDGKPVDRQSLALAVDRVRSVLHGALGPESPGGAPTFFEVATAAAFVLFQERRCDWIVLEVGLGGRLDSTNVCKPVCSIVTTVGLDHTKILGDTLEKIAWEKAGIIKPGIPAISGVSDPSAREVVRRVAHEQGSPLWELGREIDFRAVDAPWWEPDRHAILKVRTPIATHEGLPCPLAGSFQWGNLALAVGALDRLADQATRLNPEVLKRGLLATVWPGRLEILHRKPLVIADGAHNPDSAQALAREIARIPITGKRRFLVAISSDKDLRGVLEAWTDLADEFHFTRYRTGTRAASPEALEQTVPTGFSGKIARYENPLDAWNAMIQSAQPADLVIVTGSLFLVGELRTQPWQP